MVDLVRLMGIFGDEVFGPAQRWTKPKVTHFRLLAAVLEEPVVRRLHAAGHEFCWSREAQLPDRKHHGWKLVVQRDAVERPTIFMDRKEELVLLHRAQR